MLKESNRELWSQLINIVGYNGNVSSIVGIFTSGPSIYDPFYGN